MLTALILAATATAVILTAVLMTGRGQPPPIGPRDRAEMAARLWVM